MAVQPFGTNIMNALTGLQSGLAKAFPKWSGVIQPNAAKATETPAVGAGTGVNWNSGISPQVIQQTLAGKGPNLTNPDMPGAYWTVDPASTIQPSAAQLSAWKIGPSLAGIQAYKNPGTGREEFYWRQGEDGVWTPIAIEQAWETPPGYVGEGEDRTWKDPVLKSDIFTTYSDRPNDWPLLGDDAARFYQYMYEPDAGTWAAAEDRYNQLNPDTTNSGQDLSWLQELMSSGLLGYGASSSLSTGLSEDMLSTLIASMNQGQVQPEDIFGPTQQYGVNPQPMTVLPTF
jgi:hypothetical protein